MHSVHREAGDRTALGSTRLKIQRPILGTWRGGMGMAPTRPGRFHGSYVHLGHKSATPGTINTS